MTHAARKSAIEKDRNGGFNVSIVVQDDREWGTDLEGKLKLLPYPDLTEAFKVVAEVWEGCRSSMSVTEAVRDAKRFSKAGEPMKEEVHLDYVAEQMESDVRSMKKRPATLAWHSQSLAFLVFGNLWRIAHGDYGSSCKWPLQQIVSEVTHARLLAEKARHALYSERRAASLQELERAGVLRLPGARGSARARRTIGRDLIRLGIDDPLRWYKKHRSEYRSSIDATTALVESTLNPFDPVALYGFFRHIEAKASHEHR